MTDSFMIVGKQVLILFILMAVGFAARKGKLLTPEGIGSITSLMLYIITPCLLINAFQRDFEPGLLRGFFQAAAAAVLSHAVGIGLSMLLIRDRDRARQNVLRFAAIFSNCGYMSLPLQQALMGDEAVFYGASHIAVFNIFLWTYGLALMCNGQEKISLKKALLNPGTISVAVGLILFFGSVRLPELIGRPIEYLAALNTPVPMLIIGYYLAGIDFKTVLRSGGELTSLLLRLVLMPLLMLFGLYLLNIRGVLLVACVISASAPSAAIGTMFATKYGGEAELSAGMVAVSTLFSIVSMTLIVGLASRLAL